MRRPGLSWTGYGTDDWLRNKGQIDLLYLLWYKDFGRDKRKYNKIEEI
jgi:hypothetical protein